MNNNSRVMVIGLDGATLDLILPWVKSGDLPVMSSLLEAGSYGKLKSVYPIISPAAWSTFITGTNPGQHGVYDFVFRDQKNYQLRPVTRNQIMRPSFWRLLGEQGKRVIIINVPMTYPPEPVNGILISGLGTPNSGNFTYPEQLGQEIINKGYYVNPRVHYQPTKEQEYLDETINIIDNSTSIALSLLQQNPWDFSIIVYRETDTVAHHFWRYMDASHPKYEANSKNKDAILNTYKHIDRCIGKLKLAAGEKTTIFIVSDHGVGPLYKDVFINEWLHQNGYLQKKPIPRYQFIMSRLGITRQNISSYLRKYKLKLLEEYIKNRFKDKLQILTKEKWADFNLGIDWSKTRAYSYGYQGQIFINLIDREPNGIVKPGQEYENLRIEIRNKLYTFIDPVDRLPIVDKIFFREEIFNGPSMDNAPDIIFLMRGLTYTSRLYYEWNNLPGEIVSDTKGDDYCGHRLEGVLIASGSDIIHQYTEKPIEWLGDIAPTVLHLLGCSVPKWMDGKILSEWLIPYKGHNDIRTLDVDPPLLLVNENKISNLEEEELLNRLHDLGYLS